MSRLPFTSNKVYYFSQVEVFIAYYHSKFFLHQKENVALFGPKRSIFCFKNLQIFMQKKRVVPWK